MRLGLRLLFGFFLITGLAAFFVMRVFVSEIKPSVRQTMEDLMVDTANVLAELAAPDLAQGRMADGAFARQVQHYTQREVQARIWGKDKLTLDMRVYVTDARGIVVFDSANEALGQDFSQWRDVALTLRGEYGARSTRLVPEDARTTVMHVAAPVLQDGRIIGVLTVARPNATVQAFIDRSERKILKSGYWMLLLSTGVGVLVTLWAVWNIRKLRRYADDVEAGKTVPVPRVPGELGELAQAMDAMRERVQRREYMEAYVRALTHELKSPLAAIRGAAELLHDDLPAQDRQAFAQDVQDQTERLQALVDRMLELSKLEQRQAPEHLTDLALGEYLHALAARLQVQYPSLRLRVEADGTHVHADPELLELAVRNLLGNAAAFAPEGSTVLLQAQAGVLAVQDQGPGVPDFALPRLGERFFSTVRPDGHTKGSGLGLAIVRQIMTLHGGTLRARNTQPGLRVELNFTPTSQTS